MSSSPNSLQSPATDDPSFELSQPRIFRLSPIIRMTLTLLYIALTVPLPFLADATHAPVPASVLWVGLAIGFLLLSAALTERVVIDDTHIQVTYPAWVPKLFRKGWSLAWSDIKALKPRSTGQGGIVYYFLSHSSDRAYLLPMRIAGFAELVRHVEAKTGIDTRDVKPLAQPWMYVILFCFTLMLLAIDAWTVLVAVNG